MATDTQRAARYALANEDADKARNHGLLQRITDMGTKFWHGLSIHALRADLFDANQRGHIMNISNKLLRNGTGLTTREVEKGNVILDQFETMDLDVEDIRSLSKEEEKSIIDAEQAMQRFSAIPDGEWQRVLDLGEQTKRLTYNETKAIRALRTYLKAKSKEIFPIGQLTLVESALGKLKSLGVKI